MTLPSKFTFNHKHDVHPDGTLKQVRTVARNANGDYEEQPFIDHNGNGCGFHTWKADRVAKLFAEGYWENPVAVTDVYQGPFLAGSQLFTGKVQGTKYLVSWEHGNDVGDAKHDIYAAERHFADGSYWIPYVAAKEEPTAVAEPVPSLTEQLVNKASTECFAVTIFPDGVVVLQDLRETDGRTITMKDAGQALKWFDLKSQMEDLEVDGD